MKTKTLLICLIFFNLVVFEIKSQTNITSNITVNTTFTAANSPYIIVNSMEVNPGITLTVENGATLKFNAGTYLHVRGTLNATGATFTANNGITKGFWDGIYVSYENYETGHVNLTNCIVEYASNLYARKGDLTLNGCTLNNFTGSGVRISSLATLNIGNTTISNTNYPITFYGAGKLNPGTNLTFTNNTYQYIDLDFTNVTDSFRLKNAGLPYFNDNTINVNTTGTFIIDPGVVFNSNTEIQINGKIKAVGTESQPITFDKASTATYWRGISFKDSSVDSACVIKNCILRNALYDAENYGEALRIENASPTIENCKFRNNVRNLLVLGNSQPQFTNCVFDASANVNGEAYNMGIDLSSNPVFTSDSIKFNAKEFRAIRIIATTISGNAHLAKKSFIGIDNITYCLYGNVTVAETGTLTIDPGVVIKCRDNYSQITANGVLTGIGTTAEPIVFTNLVDDSYGNPLDTQNDGTQSINVNGIYSGRIYLNSTAQSKMENWKINYVGRRDDWTVFVKNNNIVTNCEIKNVNHGVWFTNAAKVTNNSFINVNYFPVGYFASTETPDVQGNTLSSVGISGIILDGFANNSPTLRKMNFGGYTNNPYVVTRRLNIDAANVVTIQPGVIVKSTTADRMFLVNGTLKAIGTKTEKIIFTSYRDDSAGGDTNNDATATIPGKTDWNAIEFASAASNMNNVLKNCEIRYANDYTYQAPLIINNCYVLMDSVKINFSDRCGIGIFGTANPEIKNCEIANTSWEPIYMDLFSNPKLDENNKVANVGGIALKIRGGTVNGTVPVRSFAGYNNIAYGIYETFNTDAQLTIPAGVVFKGNGRWEIRGKLNIQGAAANPVVFTSESDDAYGNPKDYRQDGNTNPSNNGSYFVFYDNSDDASVIDYAVFRYTANQAPIQLNNASPTIQNTKFEKLPYEGISLNGVSTPAINNCTFANCSFPFSTSLTSYPSATSGNTITGTTGRAIRIKNETLTQNVTLPKRDFAGITNIPYAFHQYYIGTSAKLTIQPGVIIKFLADGFLDVQNALYAVGGAEDENKIIFTADRDDFYGGDTYGDGDANQPSNNYWRSVHFENTSIDADCVLKNCIFKYGSLYWNGDAAVRITDASPDIEDCRFINCYHGIITEGTSIPTIKNCDFTGMDAANGYAVWNKNTATPFTAENCWFNSVTGPRHASNPSGTGERISDGVNFTPFAAQLLQAETGDVSLNGTINPYDASLILQHVVSAITLNSAQQSKADVSRNGAITSYDASMILQYNVGLITNFQLPTGATPPGVKSVVQTGFELGNAETIANGEFRIPLSLTTSKNVKSLDLKINYDPKHIQLKNINTENIPSAITIAQNNRVENNSIFLSMASAYDLGLDNSVVYLTFNIADRSVETSEVALNSALANESKIETFDIKTTVISKIISGTENIQNELTAQVWVNEGILHVNYNADTPSEQLNISLVDVSGRIILTHKVTNAAVGNRTLEIPLTGNIEKGIYIVRLVAAGKPAFTKKIVIR